MFTFVEQWQRSDETQRSRCDMRKGFNGLKALVANDMKEPPTSGAVYVFLNRRGDRIKLFR